VKSCFATAAGVDPSLPLKNREAMDAL